MKKYTTSGCRAVTAENMSEAAEIFADRMARKKYGKTGYARTCNLESWSQDQTLGEYSAFIGYTPAGKHNRGTTVGGNIRFSVYAEEAVKPSFETELKRQLIEKGGINPEWAKTHLIIDKSEPLIIE
jgi:hypothetical protein